MSKSTRARLAYLLIFLLVAIHGQEAEKICRNRNDDLQNNLLVKSNLKEMQSKYEEICGEEKSCSSRTQVAHADLKYNFTVYAQNSVYKRMKNACEENTGYKTCQVTTSTVFYLDNEDVMVNTHVTEVKKPVCFPPSCTPELVNVLDPFPAACNPNGKKRCRIVSYHVECPDDFILASDTSTCLRDALGPTSTFFLERSIIEASATASCQNSASDKDASGCSYDYGELEETTKINMAGFTSDSTYKAYEKSCYHANGEICNMDIIVESVLPINTTHNLTSSKRTLKIEYMDYPQCLPFNCTIDETKALAIENFAATNTLPCDANSENCKITISSTSCKKYLGNSPILSPMGYNFVSPTVIKSAFAPDSQPTEDTTPSSLQYKESSKYFFNPSDAISTRSVWSIIRSFFLFISFLLILVCISLEE